MTEVTFEQDIAYIKGGIVFASVNHVHQQVVQALKQREKLVLNLSHVTKVDSAALALLCEWRRMAKKRKLQIEFVSPPEALVNLIDLCDLQPVLTFTQ